MKDLTPKLIASALVLAFAVPPATAQQARAANVFADQVETREFVARIEALGTLQPLEEVNLTVNDAGQVQNIYFEDGERVKAQQVLVSLAQNEQKALVEAEQATVSEAQQQLDRMLRLVSRRAVSQAEVDEAQRDLDNAKAQLRAVEARQADRLVRAPFDGVLGFRQISRGTFMQPGDVVAHLVDDSAMYVDFSIPSRFLRYLETGTPVQASTNDLPDLAFEGTVETIDNAIDPVTRTVRVRAKIPNDGRALVAGMFMEVMLLANPRSVAAVPEEAVQSLGPRDYVYIIQDNNGALIAKKTEVSLGTHQDGFFEVVAGVDNGAQIVSDGIISVRDGGPLKIQQRTILSASNDKNVSGT